MPLMATSLDRQQITDKPPPQENADESDHKRKASEMTNPSNKPLKLPCILSTKTSRLLRGNIPEKFSTGGFFDELWELRPLEAGTISMFGKLHKIPRLTLNCGKGYGYTGNTAAKHTTEVPDVLQPLLDYINELGFGPFNQALVNYYRNGNDCIRKHADNEPSILENSPIVTVSLGATRVFRVTINDNTHRPKDCEMHNGSFLIMCDNFQREYKHEVPRTKQTSTRGLIAPRISVTFRNMK
jgi:alkylated DNA repair dioxygenase AlkB